MQKSIIIVLSITLMLSLCACGNNHTGTPSTSPALSIADVENGSTSIKEVSGDTESEPSEDEHEVESIDFTLEDGNLKYVGFEKADYDLISCNSSITPDDNVIILKFDFTNLQDTPAQCQSTFRTTIYQNGAELDNSLGWVGNGTEQYELVSSFYNNALKNGTVSYGELVVLKDLSPITIYAEPNGGLNDVYQVMELNLSDLSDSSPDSSQNNADQTSEAISVGDEVKNDDWKIVLSKAYTSDVLESKESSTYWTADDGYAFLVLEFDVECLNSSKKPVDGDAIAGLVANINGNTYGNWKYQYIASQIWCYFRNTYLDANLPVHAYVYTYIPSSNIDDEMTVNMNLAGTNYILTVN